MSFKKYWNSDEYTLGLQHNPGHGKVKSKYVLILAIVYLYGYLLLLNMLIPSAFLENLLFSWFDNNIVNGSNLEGTVIFIQIGIALASMIHFLSIMLHWFKIINNANK